MDTSAAVQSSEVSEPQPAFRRPSNDTSRRNYRRHSPSTSRSSSPSSSGAWKRDRSPHSLNSEDDERLKTAGVFKRGRSERGREVDRETEHARGSRAPLGYSDFRNKKHHYSKYDEHIHRRHSSYYDHKDPHSNTHFWRDDYGRSSRVECRSPSRGYREKGYDDRWRSGRVDERNPEWSYRERGDEKNRDGEKFWRDERDRDRERERKTGKDKYRDADLGLEKGKVGSRCPDLDSDTDLEISRDLDLSRENVRDRSKYREKDDRGMCREKDDGRRYKELSKGRENDYSYRDKKERDRHKGTDEVKEHGWKKEFNQQIVKECLKETACLKEREGTQERDVARNVGREGEHKNEKEKNQSDGESGEVGLSSKQKHQSELLVHKKRKASLGSCEGNDETENGTIHRKCKQMGVLTSDIHLSTEDATTGTSLEELKMCDNGLDSIEGQAKHSPGTSDGTLGRSSKWGPENYPSSEVVADTASEAEVANDLNAAKLAAMRAAELVNKNLGTCAFSSADQKKKLLWGSKKNAAAQEAAAGTNRWSTAHFPDRDRQEKFNKLMSLSAPCYQWRFVGCERRFLCGPRQRKRVWTCSTEAKGATARSREAVYCSLFTSYNFLHLE
eukprot:c28596_g1_i1 orf=669-2516(-)